MSIANKLELMFINVPINVIQSIENFRRTHVIYIGVISVCSSWCEAGYVCIFLIEIIEIIEMIAVFYNTHTIRQIQGISLYGISIISIISIKFGHTL